MSEQRLARIRRGRPTRYRVVGKSLEETLRRIAEEYPVDLVCITGDLADWGLPEEYDAAEKRLDRILRAASTPRERLYVVPGNHDVHRETERTAWEKMRTLWRLKPNDVSAWMAGDEVPYGADPRWRDAILERTAAFWAWVARLGRGALLPARGQHGRLGYRAQPAHLEFPVFILGLDSAWLAGDNADTGKLGLTKDQILQCGTSPDDGSPLQGFRIALAHHPLGDLADANESRRLLSAHADLFLYGHQHEAQTLDATDPDHTLKTLAAGSLYEGDLGDQWVNSFHVIDTYLDDEAHPLRHDVTFYAWSPNGFWHPDSALYRSAPHGRLALWTTFGRSIEPTAPQPAMARAAPAVTGTTMAPHPRTFARQPDSLQGRHKILYMTQLLETTLKNTDGVTPLRGEVSLQPSLQPPVIEPVVPRAEFALLARRPAGQTAAIVVEDVAREAQQHHRVALLGDPGAGKTTTLLTVAHKMAGRALADPDAPVPLLVNLGAWTEASQPFSTFLAQQLPALGQDFDALVHSQRATLLLDGLNEIPTWQRTRDRLTQLELAELERATVEVDGKLEKVRRERESALSNEALSHLDRNKQLDDLRSNETTLKSLLADYECRITAGRQTLRENPDKEHQILDYLAAHDGIRAVIACRKRDYSPLWGFTRIDISPLDAIRIRRLAESYLGPSRGEDLFRRLAGGNAMAAFGEFLEWSRARLPDAEATFWLAEKLPAGMQWSGEGSGETSSKWDRWLRARQTAANLLTLAGNPYMLMMVTLVYSTNDSYLPKNRSELFRNFVSTLLARERLVGIDGATNRPIPTAESTRLLRGIGRLALDMQIERATSGTPDTLTVLPLTRARQSLEDAQLGQATNASLLFVGDDVRFTHQLLQEYFVATEMLAQLAAGGLRAEDIWQPLSWWQPTGWEEATVLLAGLFETDCSPVLRWVGGANPELAADCITRSGAAASTAALDELRQQWLARLASRRKDPQPAARAAIGRALAVTNLDTRQGVGLRSNGLPDVAWCLVRAGVAFLGGDRQALLSLPARRIRQPEYYISRYPITVRQFQAFIDAPDGYRNPEWWASLPADGGVRVGAGPTSQPLDWWNHPRTFVSWYEALAFCQWMSAVDGFTITLPTEDQWEHAARGMDMPIEDGDSYVLGFEEARGRGNTEEAGLGRTCAVGLFPSEESACGARDMSGNIWEWTLCKYGDSGHTDGDGDGPRVLKGGAWSYSDGNARTASRIYAAPDSTTADYGFRVVKLPPG